MVLLHAYQATSAEWNELAGLLRSDHRVFAVDLVFDAGCSVSGRRSVASVDDLVSYLDPVLTGLGVTSPEPVGHSLGA